ncbi:substrate-binding domain-containing protein [Streptomyces sp. FIT100]|uniref:substrate-binding domain-containing protein n=1 Tax=Streptomyces sp. FIT100 TaxID=2837956 RepID=UPI0021C73581|nr:substrate-binding domain-containing protein [Streptomyces sp. FIT100]UUN25666.1 substrate-binding domain-containing protein [Streptomyces sp. FIT100]
MDAAQRHKAILRTLRRYGSVRVTELAETLGVTPITVRRDINQLADGGLLTRVHGGAVLNDTAQNASHAPVGPPPGRRGHSRTIGMVVPAISYYYREVIEGARAAADAYGMRLVIGVSRYEAAEDRAQIRQLLDQGIEGLLLTPITSTDDAEGTWRWIAELPVPVVVVERRHTMAADVGPIEYVISDHEHGATQAVRHLAGLGHRRIGLVSRTSPTSGWLRQGFRAAATTLGIHEDVLLPPEVPLPGQPGDDLDSLVSSLLESGATALLVHPDEQAVIMLHTLRARGVAVPDDMALVSYDDEFAGLADVPLTAVAPPRRELGHTGVELLTRRLHGSKGCTLRHIHLLPRLHIRASTVGTG